jgi:hypothetical protein
VAGKYIRNRRQTKHETEARKTRYQAPVTVEMAGSSNGKVSLYWMKSLEPNGMLDSKVLAELKAERAQIEEAILSLERLARGRGRGPGRPPGWMAEAEPSPKRRGRPPGSNDPGSQPPPTAAAAALPVPRRKLVWAVSGRKRPAS